MIGPSPERGCALRCSAVHGHPFPGPLQLWWGKTKPAEKPRNLFGSSDGEMPPASDRFRAGGANGHIGGNGQVRRTALHQLMAKLTQRIRRSGATTGDNGGVPSGYTYLLQFIAHDMVDSVLTFNIHDPDITPGARNARSEPLRLETLYGAGPDECPQAYEYTSQQLTRGLIPRIRLRLGWRAQPPLPPGNPYCPFRDIARNTSQKTLADEDASPLLTEAMLADPRNDAHALVSQITVLFQLLHNHVISLLEAAIAPFTGQAELPRRELAYREFHCARLVLTLIYRNIIKKDVLEHILDKRIYQRYMTDAALPFDKNKGIPLEFSFGAFRFGHAIVRDQYKVNSVSKDQPTSGAVRRTSLLAHQELLPIKSDWLVDWAHFFDNSKGIVPNFSKRIGPRHPEALKDSLLLFPAKADGVDAGGLMDRDLLSSAYAGLLSVPALIREMQERGFDIVEDLAQWQEPMRAWLTQIPGLQPGQEGPLPAGDPDLQRILVDPPLPFFVLFEAARIGRPDEAEGGRRLGPLGSVIVAETILGAIEAHPLGIEGDTLQARIKACGEALFNVPDPQQPGAPQPVQDAIAEALSEIDEIENMPQLLDYMDRQGVFNSD
jgi:Animal haem peroxidase